jgi:transcriptional regulator GlxA family with amidase domain
MDDEDYECKAKGEMTNNPYFLPTRSADRVVLFAAFPGMCLLDLAGPHTVFWAASQAGRLRGLPGYRCHTVSIGGGSIRAAEGVVLETQPAADFDARTVDTVMVPGSFGILDVIDQSDSLVDWLRQVAPRTRRMTSVCTGAFLLAEAGLLRGKRAATHWMECERFQKRFTDVAIDSDAIFVQDDPIWTSAGVTACIDLSLALVQADCGREIAMEVARELVVFLKRPGGQSQFSQFLKAQEQDRGAFEELHLWLSDNLSRTGLNVDVMAERANMSPRNFARQYKKETGRTPARALELLRLEAAKRMLEDSHRSVKQIANVCGFGSEGRMRATFLRHLAATPRDIRERFSNRAPSA